MQGKIGFCSLGCAKNQVDTEVMLGRLKEAGFELCSDPDTAEIIVVNTCAFIEEAKEESIEAILEMAELKETGRCRRLIVAGCLSQRHRAELLEEIPEIDACIGLDEIDRIVEVCTGAYVPARGVLPLPSRNIEAVGERVRTTPRHYTYLKVADGCDHRCSFCVIPLIRGRYRSRSIESLVAEARSLVAGGAVEINLVAQDLGPYGQDIGLRDGLPRLLHELAAVEGLSWLRLLYVYPEGLSPLLVETIASEPKIVPYLDIPFQHSSPRVLKAMGRAGVAEAALKKIEQLRSAIPGLAVRTSLIVGFPAEEDNDLETLLDFVRAAEFDHLGVFTYSHEEGSEAYAKLEDRWSAEEKTERRDAVMALQRDISWSRNKSRIGKTFDCLIEGYHPESDLLLAGRLPTQAPEVDGCVIITEGFAGQGEIAGVEITEAHPYDLVGRINNER